MRCVTTKTQMNRKPRRVHTESLCVLLLCGATLSAPSCLPTLFARGVGKPWIANTSLIVTDAAKRLIVGLFKGGGDTCIQTDLALVMINVYVSHLLIIDS